LKLSTAATAPDDFEAWPLRLREAIALDRERGHGEFRGDFLFQAELARRVPCDFRQVSRLLDINHRSRLDQLDAAFAALGKRLVVEVRDAA